LRKRIRLGAFATGSVAVASASAFAFAFASAFGLTSLFSANAFAAGFFYVAF
jgi:hypothetical protein